MRWQDEEPINELLREGGEIDGAYLTVARVGEDRKEAQIGSRPVDDRVAAREWLDSVGANAVGAEDHARLRIRLWRPDRTPVRGIQTRAWPAPAELSDAVEKPYQAETTAEIDEVPPPRSIAVRPPATPVRSVAAASRVATRIEARPRPTQPAPAPCLTCAATTTTVALLQSRIAELSAMLAAASTAVRDAQRAAQDAEQTARSRGRRLKEAEVEIARLRAEEKRLDAQVVDLYNGLVQVGNTLPNLDD